MSSSKVIFVSGKNRPRCFSSASDSSIPKVSPEVKSDESNRNSADDETVGVNDPYLDSLLPAPPSTDDPNDDSVLLDANASPALVEPRDLDMNDADGNGLDIAIDLIADETLAASEKTATERDDINGPLDIEAFEFAESDAESFTDGAEEGPVEAPIVLEEPSLGRAHYVEKDDDESGDDPIGLYVDDADLPWAKERWTEHTLGQTFSARRHIALVGNTLCVAGDETHLHDSRNFALLEKLPLTQKSARVLALDTECKALVLLTTAGRLLSYGRSKPGEPQALPVALTLEMVSDLWQLAPGVPSILVRLESGQTLELGPNGVSTPTLPAPQQRLIAVSEVGEPRVSLIRISNGLELRSNASGETRLLRLSPEMQRAANEHRTILLGFNEAILFGARNHGLWLYTSKTQNFEPVPGCRTLTAITVGRIGTRPTAFVGLFSELEDRAEIATVDLTTGRASKIAELCIHSDCSGPEDDPPELARIDALVWDSNNGKLWVAGSFGLTCFTQPASMTTS